jgi:hypothetical protein
MTFCVTVASRPPHSFGHEMAAQRPFVELALPRPPALHGRHDPARARARRLVAVGFAVGVVSQ